MAWARVFRGLAPNVGSCTADSVSDGRCVGSNDDRRPCMSVALLSLPAWDFLWNFIAETLRFMASATLGTESAYRANCKAKFGSVPVLL